MEWHTVPKCPQYAVNEAGQVKNIITGKLLRGGKDRDGYHFVILKINGKTTNYKLHRLIAEVFIPNPEMKKYVQHIDGNRSNNVVDNLRWVTAIEKNARRRT